MSCKVPEKKPKNKQQNTTLGSYAVGCERNELSRHSGENWTNFYSVSESEVYVICFILERGNSRKHN